MSQWAAFASDQTLGSFLRAQKAFVIIIDNLLVALIEFWCVKKSGRTGLVSRQVQRDEHERERPGYIVLGCVTSDRAILWPSTVHIDYWQRRWSRLIARDRSTRSILSPGFIFSRSSAR